MSYHPMISFILPNRNEPNIHKVISEIEQMFPGCQIIICCDKDGHGKGWAIREALDHATGKYIAFLDGDGDIPVRMLKRLIPFLDDYDIVVGRKDYSGSLARKIITLLSRIYIKVLFNINDSQTGIKIFKHYALPRWKTDGWLFDVEILARAKKLGFTMCEVPVFATISKKIYPKALWKTFLDSWRIKWELKKEARS